MCIPHMISYCCFSCANGFIYSKLIVSFSLTFSPIGSGNNGGIIKCVYTHTDIFLCVWKKDNRQTVVSQKTLKKNTTTNKQKLQQQQQQIKQTKNSSPLSEDSMTCYTLVYYNSA